MGALSDEAIEVRTLREWRVLRGYGQRELARLAGVAYTTVAHLERGQSRGYPATWRRLADVLEVDVVQILEYRQAFGLDRTRER